MIHPHGRLDNTVSRPSANGKRWGRSRHDPPALPPDQRCSYPDCPWSRDEEDDEDAELCRRNHSTPWPPGDREGLRANDGIVDWQAIALVAAGLRRVRLTWVERDIAIAVILGMGLDVADVLDRTGYTLEKDGSKYRRLLDIGRRHYGQRLVGDAGSDTAA